MTYNHAVLGESLELNKDAAKWFAAEKERLEKSRQASKEVMDSIRPMVIRRVSKSSSQSIWLWLLFYKKRDQISKHI